MEKKSKEIIETTEQEENNTNKKQSDKKNNNIKKILLITLGIVLVLCIGIFIFIRINTTETHVYEEVENLAEREGVCFDNLLLSCAIGLYNNQGESDYRYLCIFSTGDIYCFTWSGLTPWNWYYKGDKEHDYKTGYDDTSWSNAENVIYLGRLSNRDTIRLNQYVQDYDIEGRYYRYDGWYPQEIPNSSEENWQNRGLTDNAYLWRYYEVNIYWHEQPEGYSGKDEIIEWCEMNYLGDDTYEKGEIMLKSYEENALAILELFESSGFYDRWVSMCLNK